MPLPFGTRHSQFKSLPHKHAFNLAWPMILANISTPLMGLVDTAMLGHLDNAKFIGAVAIGSNVLTFMFWMFAFLRMGTTSLTGKAFGADDTCTIVRQLVQNSTIGFLLGALVILFQFITIPFAMYLMAPDAELRNLATQYCQIRIYSAPAVLVTYVTLGWFIGLHNTRIPLIITVFSNLINIVLDYFFIVKWGWESNGAAVATLIAEYLALAVGLLAIAIQLRKFALPKIRIKQYFNTNDWRALLKLNTNLFIRTSILLFVFNFFTAQSATLGENYLAANAIILQLVMFTSLALDGYAHAAETMIARALGANKLSEFYAACWATSIAGAVIALCLSIAFWLLNDSMILLMTDLDNVVTTTVKYLPWLYLMPLVSVWCYLMDGIFIGAGQTQIMRNYMLIAVVLVFLPMWLLLKPLQNHGLWAALTVFNIFRGCSLMYAFRKLSVSKSWI